MGQEYFYDLNGNCVKEIWYRPTGNNTEFQYVYDTNGIATQSFVKREEENLQLQWKNEYEVVDNQTKEKTTFYDDGKAGGWIESETTYDSYGNKLTYTVHDDDGGITQEQWDYIYDENGRCLKESMYFDNSLTGEPTINTTEYVYNKNGNCILEIYSTNEEPNIMYFYRYEKFEH